MARIFDRIVAATGPRDEQATDAGYRPLTVAVTADDHKRYFPGASQIHMRITGETNAGRLLGVQLAGPEIAKCIDSTWSVRHVERRTNIRNRRPVRRLLHTLDPAVHGGTVR